MSGWAQIWLAYLVLGVAIEAVAIFNKHTGDTLSEQVWTLRGSGVFSLILFFLAWVVWHFIFDGRMVEVITEVIDEAADDVR